MLPMNETSNSLTTRREFIKATGRLAAASALAGVAIPHVHAAAGDLIQDPHRLAGRAGIFAASSHQNPRRGRKITQNRQPKTGAGSKK